MNQRFLIHIRTLLFSIDLAAFNIAFLFSKKWFEERISSVSDSYYDNLWLFTNLAWLVAMYFSNVYSEKAVARFETFCKKTFQTYIYFMLLVVLYLFFYKQISISRLFIICFLFLDLNVLLLNRIIYFIASRYFNSRKYTVRKIMIIGYNDLAKKLATHFELQEANTEIVGFCEEEENVYELSHYPIVSSYDDVIDISRQNEVNEIYSTIAPESNLGIYKLMLAADQACIRFKVVPDLNFFIRKPIHLEYLGNMPVISLRKEPLNDVSNRIRKRTFDLIFSFFVIVFILTWLIPIISFFILIENFGPIFFLQKRSGKDNKPFVCIKFRSMYISSDAHEKQATKNDKRITRVGKFLRKTNLDEFPQFINVFMGQMSIVGPRPHMLKHTDDYSKLLDQYMVRQFLKPGITGWAQSNGFRGETKTIEQMQKRVEYDLWYLENWSLWLDTKIILKTLYNMLIGEKNAY